MPTPEQDSPATWKIWILLLKVWIGLAAILGFIFSLARSPSVSNLKLVALTLGLTTFVIAVGVAGFLAMVRFCVPRENSSPTDRGDDV